ncbi:MAG TPA: hypothetical protein VFV22_00375 [Candidatus Paceibacterota bacterium]|nr:hypothetical protein [Candidatus Paceibacterota bacterium]
MAKRNSLCVILLGMTLIAYVVSFFISQKSTDPTNLEPQSGIAILETARIADLELSYTKSPSDYILVENYQTWPENIISSITLFRAEEYKLFSQPDFVGETSPSFTISVFTNTEQLSPLEWVKNNPLISNYEIDQRSEVESYEISGVVGIKYSINGLYLFDIYAFSYGEHIYLLSKTYYEVGDMYYEDYGKVLASASFK